MISDSDLERFVVESNKIEGIERTTPHEVVSSRVFLNGQTINVTSLIKLVSILQPNAQIRSQLGLDVQIGNHFPPLGGPNILRELQKLLVAANNYSDCSHNSPFTIHNDYETLHPFTDGNGRSGRLLWLWMMEQRHQYQPKLGFLHTWYYQSLGESRAHG